MGEAWGYSMGIHGVMEELKKHAVVGLSIGNMGFNDLTIRNAWVQVGYTGNIMGIIRRVYHMFKQTHITYVFGCFSTNLKSEHMTQQSWLHHSLLRLFNSMETEMQQNATNQTPLFIGKANTHTHIHKHTHTHEMRLLIRMCLSDIGVSGLCSKVRRVAILLRPSSTVGMFVLPGFRSLPFGNLT